MKKVLASLACLLVGVAIPSGLNGQIYKDAYSPFEPGYFDHDLQFFAPGEFDEFGGESLYPTGWYFNYNRMYVHASRPFTDVQNTQTDPTWGNRFQVGFMTEEKKGLELQYYRVDGPNEFSRRIVEVTPDDGMGMGGMENVTDFNDFRSFGETHSVEVNRTYRMCLESGAIVEALIGPRYISFTDTTPKEDEDNPGTFLFFRNENDIIAGQLGLRAYNKHGRWTLFGSVKAFPGYNHQIFSDGFGGEDEFVIGGEVRLEAAFHVTRDIAFVLGYDFYYLGRGIARVDNRATNDQPFLMHGIVFGFQVNMP